MKVIADFHIHSKYSRATSRTMDLDYLNQWGKIKGVNLLGTGDFTHPLWFKEIQKKLEPAENELFVLKNDGVKLDDSCNWYSFNNQNQVRFMLTAEISCIYKKNDKTRRVHILIFAPDMMTVEKINKRLGQIGNIKSDGRPILGLGAKELLKIVLDINSECLIIPAHAWTPWFSIFGSNSGFNTIEECFDDESKYIYAIETGLSSDPAMNWQISALDKITLISNSDCHSPSKIGREANVFEIEKSKFSYAEIANILKEKNQKKFLYTVEFFPEEGKYHYDGHRVCGTVFSPEETKKLRGLCPRCGRPLTIGVANRVYELADRKIDQKPAGAIPFKNLISLDEIIGDALQIGKNSKNAAKYYRALISNFGDEFKILLEADLKEIKNVATDRIAEGIKRVRDGKVRVAPGYDGEYGKIKIFNEEDNKKISKQGRIF